MKEHEEDTTVEIDIEKVHTTLLENFQQLVTSYLERKDNFRKKTKSNNEFQKCEQIIAEAREQAARAF